MLINCSTLFYWISNLNPTIILWDWVFGKPRMGNGLNITFTKWLAFNLGLDLGGVLAFELEGMPLAL